MAERKKLRTVVVGFGFMGQTHACNIMRSDSMELVAVVDPRPDALHGITGGNIKTDAVVLSGVRQYSSLEACLAAEEVELAYVCVHTRAHFAVALLALQHGVHVFVEKPFVLEPEEGATLIAEAQRRKLHLGVAHVVRFMPAYVKLRTMFCSGLFGKLKFISLTRFSGVPEWGEWKQRRAEFGSSGGGLFDLCLHDIDFLHYMLGIPDDIDADCLPGALSPHDYVCASWRYAGQDMYVKVEGGNTFPASFPFMASFMATFEKSTLVWNSNNGAELQVITDNGAELVLLADANDGYRDEGMYFADCILNNSSPESCSAESSLETVKLCYRHLQN
ncbi:MAG: Gfo/Idh/MocA family oxidoreductase [Bacteroidales bacterium]|jgi:predicted dehydrogenase|nr:Gfo/Idh/MocA family oxidoreductase [Bacteroidales bacterium]